MTIDNKLLEILVCPITKLPVEVLDAARLERLNELIEKGEICFLNGEKVENPIGNALITNNGTTLYAVEDSIPVMLEDRSIPCNQIEQW